jgi:hypothetical protein
LLAEVSAGVVDMVLVSGVAVTGAVSIAEFVIVVVSVVVVSELLSPSPHDVKVAAIKAIARNFFIFVEFLKIII